NYASVPAWLDEGLAVANEASPDPTLAVALDQATREDRLFPFAQLCAPFPPDAGQALLAYAQSGSLIQFVRDRYGAQGIRDLLKVYGERASCGPGVERALNITLAALENEWRNRSTPGPETAGAVVETSAPWLALWLIISLALLPVLGGLPLLARRKAR
ncbi:MAG TPA: peptidase MA family metallohydrolase, partial [Anaerolineae bacterium]|nr:peptidase MA family metallohydrolase [Anaerolineae bacterium]